MSLYIDLSSLTHKRNAAAPRVGLVTPVVQKTEQASPSSIVNISSAAIAKASQSATTQATDLGVQAPNALREEIGKYDFTAITPNQLTQLAVDLTDKKELSPLLFPAFAGVQSNTIVEMDPNKPINLAQHFDWMLSIVSDAAQSDSTLARALEFRQEASRFLNDMISFTSSDREHISTSVG